MREGRRKSEGGPDEGRMKADESRMKADEGQMKNEGSQSEG